MKFRIIPMLLYKNGSLVTSIGFKDHRIVGDLTSSVRVFSKRQGDEMIIYDLDARQRGEPNYNLLKYAVENCNMPLTMGGGIRSVDDASVLLDGGCDKISVSSLLYENLNIVSDIANKYGSQAVVASLDYVCTDYGRCFYSNNGQVSEGHLDINKFVQKLVDYGVGEITLNSIDRDGTMTGFDKNLIVSLGCNFKLPLIIAGGCQSADDIFFAEQHGFSGAAAGSIFYWKGDSISSLKSELLTMGSNVRAII